mmetsp:Transcript_4588/g.6767  ORF Transcript_4588/g.6767 Transcript_4588/m.6767 type:complete len:189 (+) Transcript_4588:53-619(+)
MRVRSVLFSLLLPMATIASGSTGSADELSLSSSLFHYEAALELSDLEADLRNCGMTSQRLVRQALEKSIHKHANKYLRRVGRVPDFRLGDDAEIEEGRRRLGGDTTHRKVLRFVYSGSGRCSSCSSNAKKSSRKMEFEFSERDMMEFVSKGVTENMNAMAQKAMKRNGQRSCIGHGNGDIAVKFSVFL